MSVTYATTPILCCECRDCFVDRTGDTCTECMEFATEAARPSWELDEPYVPDAYDRARDRDEEDRCHAD